MKFALNNCKDYQCSEEHCAWWNQYPNGEGECVICVIHSLPGLFDDLQDVCKEISIK